jgi:hypothetical protein
MVEFIVAVDHLTYDAVQAEDEVTAIDLVLLGEQELEISSVTRDASMTGYERRKPRRHTSPEGGPSHRSCHHDMTLTHAVHDHDALNGNTSTIVTEHERSVAPC